MQRHFNSAHSDSADSDFVYSDSADFDSAHSDSADSDFVHSNSEDSNSNLTHSKDSSSKDSSSRNSNSNSNSIDSNDSNLIAHFNDINRVISIDEKTHSIKSRLFTSHWVMSLSSSTQLTHFLKLSFILHTLFFIKHDWQRVLINLLWRRILVAVIECFLFTDKRLRFDKFKFDTLFILKTNARIKYFDKILRWWKKKWKAKEAFNLCSMFQLRLFKCSNATRIIFLSTHLRFEMRR
jgi:hypothetical protein